MAIVIKEQKNKSSFFSVAVIIMVGGGLFLAAYYLFFTPVPLIDKFAPLSLESLKQISSIKINPDGILENPSFQVLKQYVGPVSSATSGRSNPFAPTR